MKARWKIAGALLLAALLIGAGASWLLRQPRTVDAEAAPAVAVVARGSIAYSAVIQPLPCPLRKAGTLSSTLTEHSTRVFPISIIAEPSAKLCTPGAI